MLLISKARKKIRAALCAAIKTRRVIEFYYHGGYRTVEPFCLGVVLSEEADNESLLCYQVGGYSEFREPVGWKLYRASEIEDLESSRERFSSNRPGYDPDNLEMKTVYCCVTIGADEEVRAAPEPKIEKKMPSFEAPREPVKRYLTHNELMRIFRFDHPDRLPELDTIHYYWSLLSGHSHNPLPERIESKFTPLIQLSALLHYKDNRLSYGESEKYGISVSPKYICIYPH